MRKKGYMLVETLIISITVASILIYLFSQFTNVQTFYNEVYKYNNVNELYLTGTIKDILVSNNSFVENTLKKLSDKAKNICNSGNCSNIDNINSTDKLVLADLIHYYGVKNIIIAKGDNPDAIKDLIQNGSYSKTMKEFASVVAEKSEEYRIIVEYEDNQVATILFNLK